jgi:hypothetical protein
VSTQKRGAVQNLLSYFTSNADRPITLNELVENVGYDRGQCTTAANNLVNNPAYPQMIRTGQGIYMWATKESAKDKTEMLVTILMRKEDGSMLVKDCEDEVVYVVRPLEF